MNNRTNTPRCCTIGAQASVAALLAALAFTGGCEESTDTVEFESAGIAAPDAYDADTYDADVDADMYATGTTDADIDEDMNYTAGAAGTAGATAGMVAMPVSFESTAPQQVRAGQQFEYQLTVRNNSNQAMHDLVVRDTGNTNTTFNTGNSQQSSMQGQQNKQQAQQDGQNAWRVGMLMPGQSRTVTVTGYAPQQGEMRSCMIADYQPAICQTIEVVEANLSFERNIMQEMVYACEPIDVVYRVRNTGDAESRSVNISEQLPGFLQTEDGQSQIDLTIDSVPAGETIERTVRIMPNDAGQWDGTATVTAGDSTARSNPDQVRVLKPELDVTIDGPQTEYLGRDVTYTVTVSNTSDAAAREVALQMPGISDMNRVSIGTRGELQGDSVSIGTIEAGEQRQFQVRMTPDSAGQMNLEVVATGYCVDDRPSDQITTELRGVPALQIFVIDEQDPVTVGGETYYLVRVLNEGNAPIRGLDLTGELPSGMSFVGADGRTQVSRGGQQGQQAGGQNASGGQLTFGTIDELAPGQTAEWRVQVRVNQPGAATFTVRASSDTLRQDVRSEEPTTLIPQSGTRQRDNSGG